MVDGERRFGNGLLLAGAPTRWPGSVIRTGCSPCSRRTAGPPLRHRFPDHQVLVAEDLTVDDDLPVLMSDKDAVNCNRSACNNCWVVRVAAIPDENFVARLAEQL